MHSNKTLEMGLECYSTIRMEIDRMQSPHEIFCYSDSVPAPYAGGKQVASWPRAVFVSRIQEQYFNPWTNINPNEILRFSSYRAENTLSLGYKNQSVNAV
jgi:hypothetical protein